MRTSDQLTNAEISHIESYAQAHGLETEGPDGDKNANEIVDYYLNFYKEEINERTLPLAVEQLRKAGRLVFKSAAKAKFDQAIKGMTYDQYEKFRTWLRRQRLVTTGDEGYENAENIISWVREKNLPLEDHSFTAALSNITNNGHYGHAQLHWHVKLQDSQAAAAKQKEEAAKQPARDVRTELVGENTLAPHLREHRRQMHAALAEAEARKQAEFQPVNRDSEWKSRAESAVPSIQSHNDRAEAAKFLEKAGGWGWELTFKQIQNFIERRKLERSMAGRR